MRKLLTSGIFLAAGLGILLQPGEAAACKECVWGTCLLGCSVEMFECFQYEYCMEQPEGHCTVLHPCPPQFGSATTDLSGTFATATSLDEYDYHFARVEEARGVVYRRPCNGALVGRSYRPEVAGTMDDLITEIAL